MLQCRYTPKDFLCKDNARREENEMNSFISYPEPKLILFKDNARREENEMNSFISYPEPELILCKDKANCLQHKQTLRINHCVMREKTIPPPIVR